MVITHMFYFTVCPKKQLYYGFLLRGEQRSWTKGYLDEKAAFHTSVYVCMYLVSKQCHYITYSKSNNNSDTAQYLLSIIELGTLHESFVLCMCVCVCKDTHRHAMMRVWKLMRELRGRGKNPSEEYSVCVLRQMGLEINLQSFLTPKISQVQQNGFHSDMWRKVLGFRGACGQD